MSSILPTLAIIMQACHNWLLYTISYALLPNNYYLTYHSGTSQICIAMSFSLKDSSVPLVLHDREDIVVGGSRVCIKLL